MIFRLRFFVLLLALMIFVYACSREHGQSKQSRMGAPVPVTVSTAVQKDVPIQLYAIGNMEAYSTVSVKSQVEGQLVAVYFKEGQDVRKGDLLFLIDPRPFEASLKQAEANLTRDTVQAENAQMDAERYAELLKEELVSKQQYDKVRTNAEALKAIVKADNAALENAKLQLQYCYIKSPIDGRIGNILVNKGNMVKSNDTTMSVINQVIPIYVNFSVPEQELIRIKKYMSSGKLKVVVTIPGNEPYSATGELVFINNAVDTATGTIMLKAVFLNKDRVLWPGQFVDARLILGIQHNAVVVLSQAIQTGQEGQNVFVVKSDLTAELRPVVTGIRLEQESTVEKGLQPGEVVVTDGQLRLTPGAKVEIKK